jgi:putative GTP pyrophosphokinase
MGTVKLKSIERKQIDSLVQLFLSHIDTFDVIIANLRREILSKKTLATNIHSLKTRVKDPESLRDKLERKLREAKARNRPLSINPRNLFANINDLGGLKILHLHTGQIEDIDSELRRLFRDHSYKLIEGPIARTWDDESRRHFSKIGIRTIKSASLYTSIHYVIRTNTSARYTCEVQVRTLMEEVWGEVDHSINYPHRIGSIACQEQILALARATSACSRLVDAVFRSHAEYVALSATSSRGQPPRGAKPN